MNSSDSFGFGGIWGVIMLLIVAGIFSGGLGWGANGVAAAGITRAELDNEFTQRDIFNNTTAMLQGNTALNTEILNNRFNCSQNYSNLRYDNAIGQANIEKDILLGNQSLQAQMASCCCDIKSLVRDEVQGVKDLINNNTIQDLRDQLNTATVASANAVQTQNILGNLGRFYINQPINPYYAYGTYGYNGTTII